MRACDDIFERVPADVTVQLFADDAKLYCVFTDNATAECLQACLSMIAEWSEPWQLKLSAYRCFVLHVSPVQSQRCLLNKSYHIGDVALLSVNTVCDLGVTYNISFTVVLLSILLILCAKHHCVPS